MKRPPPAPKDEQEPAVSPQTFRSVPKKQTNQLEFEFASSDKTTTEDSNEVQKAKKPSILSSLEKLGLGEKDPKYDNHIKITDQMIKIISSSNRSMKITRIPENVAVQVASNIKKVISKMPIALATSELSAPLKALE